MKVVKWLCFNNLLLIIHVLLASCSAGNTYTANKLTREDTTRLVQRIISDKQLGADVKKAFGNVQFKLIEGIATQTDEPYVFAGKPVKIVPSPSKDILQIHVQHPNELYVSIPSIKFFTRDSASVILIFHAGNATDLYTLKKEQDSWVIRGHQYGKF
ncbi:hypothetical protein [Spirosoma sp. KNUC1025]|uniref:hypothetical protein n=1 Tax=Spirosoma sp. KNUC1025 TaxID=2894082 RepID=UPI0038684B34|nr:hypothetical protein LN737_08340 [Spirosoma sp. KNUC1025]